MSEGVRDGIEPAGAGSSSCPDCGREVPETAPMGLCPRCCLEQMMLGRMPRHRGSGGIEDLEIVRVLGEGGFGTVYECLQVEPTVRSLALKLLKDEVMSAGVRARFQDEMETLERLEHPNIAKLVGAGVNDDGAPYYLMELVEGVPLDRWLAAGQRDAEARLEVAVQLARAVACAHENGVVHRDLKPENVLVVEGESGPVVKVIDFGMARVLEGPGAVGRELTQAMQFVGTPHFASPEQLAGEEIDERSDVYVMGLLLYLLAGERVVLERLADVAMSWVERHAFVRDFVFPPVREIARGDGWGGRLREWDWVARRAVAFDRAERYATAGELLDDLEAMRSGRAVSGGRTYWDYRARKFVGRHRWVVAVVGVALLGIGALAVNQHLASEQSERAEERVAASSEREREAVREAEEAAGLLRVKNSDIELEEGSRLMERGLFSEARGKLEASLELNPLNREARYALDVLATTAAFAEELDAVTLPVQAKSVEAVPGTDAVVVANDRGEVVLSALVEGEAEVVERWDTGPGTVAESLRLSDGMWSVRRVGEDGEDVTGAGGAIQLEGASAAVDDDPWEGDVGGEAIEVYRGARFEFGVSESGRVWKRPRGDGGEVEWALFREGPKLAGGGFSVEGDVFFAFAAKGVAQAFDVDTGEAVMAPLVFGGGRERAAYLPGAGMVVVVDGSDRLRCWDVSRAGRQYAEAAFDDLPLWVAFKEPGEGLVVACSGGEVWGWASQDGVPEAKINMGGIAKDSVKLTPGEWEGELSDVVQEFFIKWYFWRHVEEPGTTMTSLESSIDRTLGCSGTGLGSVTVFRAGGGVERVARLDGDVTETAISWEAGWMAAATAAGEVVCFPTDDPQRQWRATLPGGVYTLTLSDEPRRLVAGGRDGRVRISDLGEDGARAEAGMLVVDHGAVLGGGEEVEMLVRMRPHSREFATVMPGDRRVKFWDVDSGEESGEPLEHDGEIALLVFSSDGAFAFTLSHPDVSGRASEVRVWSARTHKEVTPPLVHGTKVLWATIIDGGRRIATSDEEGTLRWWDFPQSPEG